MRVLVVDDEPTARDVARRILEAEGHEVEICGDGREAVEEYSRQPFDVVLLDLLMPHQDGIETINTFRTRFPEARIIAMTGGDDVHLRSAQLLGAVGGLRKPYRRTELLDVTAAAAL